MREIEFRAWDVEKKKFHYPKLWDNSMPINWQRHYKLYQYTGLKDKNGTKIFEGDILREPPKDKWDENNFSCFEVFFHDGDSNSDYNIGYSITRMYNHGSVCGGFIPSFKPKQVSKMIVIGNIHDNPELLNID